MYGDNLPPGCTPADIERQAGVGDDDEVPSTPSSEPGMDPETWDDRDGDAAQHAVSASALDALRRLMGLSPLPKASA